MAAIKFSRKEFEKEIKITKEIEEKISLFGTHLESLTNEEIELEIMPNRPDLYSLHGFIRAFKRFIGKEKGLKEYKLNKPEKNFQVEVDKSTLKVRPYTACCIVKNLKFDDEKIKEIIDIQEKIHNTLGRNRKKIAIGIYPLEKITLPITLSAEAPKDIKFQPLEMDREMNALQILQSHPTGREYAHLLEGYEKFPVFRDAKKSVLSMPPIINSHETGKITLNTKEIFIECSGFNIEILKKTINILATMFSDIGGKVYQMNIKHAEGNYTTPDLTPEKIKIVPENINKLLGLELKDNEIKSLLEKAGYNYNTSNKTAEIPAYRTDIMHEVDLIEDIAIAYGYNNFKPEIPQISTIGEISRTEVMKKKISELLCGLNMIELATYHLLTKDDAKLLGIKEKEAIEVEKSKSEYKILKPNLLVSTLKILSQNVDNEYPQRIFELGKVFEFDKENKSETGVNEPERLCIALANNNSGFTEIKQTLDYLTRMLSKEYKLEPCSENPFFIEGRCGRIIVNNKSIGHIGEIKPQVLSNLGIKMPVAALELDIEQFC